MALRFDFGTLGKLERTPQGGVIVPASLTRTGVFEYLRDGKIVREYRPPEEVFSPASLATLRGATVTNRHPAKMVDPSTWKDVSIGHVVGDAVRNDKLLDAPLAIQDATGIQGLESGDLCEVSCGYHVDTEDAPGVTPDGEAFDLIQRNIRFNHVALGPRGWGRAGESASLRLDAADAVQVQPNESRHIMTEWIDGVEYKVGTPEHAQAKARQNQARLDAATADAARTQRITTLEADVTRLTGERDTAQGRADAADSTVTTLRAENERLRRGDVERRARAVMGAGYRADEKIDAFAIMQEVIKKKRPDLKLEGKSPDYIAGVFESVVGGGGDAPAGDDAPALDSAVPPADPTAPPPAPGDAPRTDSKDPRERMIARNQARALTFAK